MKISAIRLKEVGRFSAPVALEGLTGGLDVLAGPNELGKSTILKAVNTALFVPYTSKKQEIEELRPYAGGAPVIELDIEVEGRPWRLRKQYLASRSAELRDMTTGQLARGADAETQLATLLRGGSHFALLCVTQGAAMAAMAPVRTGGATFMAAIENEVENVSDGSASRLLAERVKAELASLVTSHVPPRPAGALKEALERRDGLLRQREEAQARLERAQARLDQLEELRARLAQVADAAAVAARSTAAAEARRAYEEARDARGRCAAAEQRIASCQRERDALAALLDTFDKSVDELAALEAAAREMEPRLAECAALVEVCGTQAGESRRAREAIKASLTTLERERRALDLRERLQGMTERVAAARGAESERAAAVAALAANTADDKAVEAARREAAGIAAIEARLSAAAPRLSLAYVPGGAGKIKVDGRPLADGDTLNPTRPVTLHIEGIGTLTVAPGQSDDVARDEAELAARRHRIAALLNEAGAGSLAEAAALLVERRGHQGRLAEAVASLKALAPEGLARLERAHCELAAQLAASGVPEQVSEDAIEARAHELGEALRAAEEKLKACDAEERAAGEALADWRGRAASQSERIATLTAALGTATARTAAREEKRLAVDAAQAALNAAVREGGAWREKAPDDARLAALKSAMDAAETASAQANEELTRLRRIEAGLEGELKSDRSDDVAARVAELTELCAGAEARCRDLQEEAAALQLLAQELDVAAARTRDRFAKPIVARLAPYLQLLMPQARLVLGEDLAPQALERASQREDFARLSGGTQEQLGLLVRLAFARLLADTGAPAPLIIDDAVVNTDDDRLLRLFQALHHAAQSHQVLVLTCRERDFEALGGHRIALATWEDARAAA